MFRFPAAFSISLPLFAAIGVVCAHAGAEQPRGNEGDSVVESIEARAALNAMVKENEALERRLSEAEESKAGLQKNLAVATGETEILKRQLMELQLRFEAFGLQGQSGEKGLEQRLLSAVAALRKAEQDKSALATAVIALLDSVEKSRESVPAAETETKAMIEAAVRQGRLALAEVDGSKDDAGAATAHTVHDGSVLATRDENALVVTNLGREAGVKLGMPFRVMRGNQEIAFIRIVAVRDQISGAVIQELASASEKIKVGDKLKIGADRQM